MKNLKKLFSYFIMFLLCFPVVVFSKEMRATDYILSLTNDADNSNIEEIGDTELAYDNTVDKNLRW